MPRLGFRTALALAVVALAALATFLLDGGAQAAPIVLVCGAAAVLIAGMPGEAIAVSTPPASSDELRVAEVIEAIVEPVLVIAANRVIEANRAARALLGQHIMGEDVRIAIRHPAAAERLLDPDETGPAEPTHLSGLGTRDQRWEMRVRTIGDRRVVHLVDRTGSYTSDRIRVDFVANASHELRTPLASLLGYVETLRDEADADQETRQRFLKIMFDEAWRMQRLIEDLISLSRIEAEKYRAPDQSVDLAALIGEVREEIVAGGDPRAHDLRLDIGRADPVRGDRAQLSQVLHNLIGNSMKYGRPGTPVTITLRQDKPETVELSVRDQSEGIAPEHLPRLTERFYRVDSGRSRAMGGTGLGLAIVKHIVERHRGQLDLASRLGEGSTVTLRIPAHPGTVTKA